MWLDAYKGWILVCFFLQSSIWTIYGQTILSEKEKNQFSTPAWQWKPLQIVLLKEAGLSRISPEIFDSLVTAIKSLNQLVYVRDYISHQSWVKTSEISRCFGYTNLHRKKEPEIVKVEGFQPEHFSFNKLIAPESGLDLGQFGNFLLLIQTNQKICMEDNYLLAAAAPCLTAQDIDGHIGGEGEKGAYATKRPLLGRLIICLKSKQWAHFQAAYAFPIFYGFGLLNPDKSASAVPPKTYQWSIFYNGGMTTVPYTAYFMDFAREAKEYAKEHFGCEDIDGIEAEDADKVHLSEYIFGNELMTPVINNGANYFTRFSASILEETYHGNMSWYITNRHLVDIESKSYWWARQAGCAFLTKSCFELLHLAVQQQKDTSEYEDRWQNDNQYGISDRTNRVSLEKQLPLPFCDEKDYLLELTTHAPKQICLTNGSEHVYYTAHCQLATQLKIKPVDYKPILLQSQFPQLDPLLNGRGVYGSDYDYRYCPFPRAVTEGELKNIPWNARLVNCEHYS